MESDDNSEEWKKETKSKKDRRQANLKGARVVELMQQKLIELEERNLREQIKEREVKQKKTEK